MASATNESYRVAGCSVNVMRGGKGPPLLFLHGAGGAGIWLPFMAALSERYDVIVPDHPGFGRSEQPEWLDELSDLAYFYLDFIEALGLDARPSDRQFAGRLDRGRARGAQHAARCARSPWSAPRAFTSTASPRATYSYGRRRSASATCSSTSASPTGRLAQADDRRGNRHRAQERAHHRGSRLAAALPSSAAAQVAAPDRRPDADRMGRRPTGSFQRLTARHISA